MVKTSVDCSIFLPACPSLLRVCKAAHNFGSSRHQVSYKSYSITREEGQAYWGDMNITMYLQTRAASVIVMQVLLTGVKAEAVKALVDLLYLGGCSLEQVGV